MNFASRNVNQAFVSAAQQMKKKVRPAGDVLF
jgi:hypothetical protein